ncbi:amino acid kinase family protein [Escherichia coli P0301867.4]|nr:amino acid kinase family protein [Escherichia coli P0301867.4]ENA43986.1 amino acid kinase family protein [Escherichia coli P0301867.2]ENA60230.1 amino acid kinase family protein [Escherichia coli 178900]ENC90161.1 amino acid kinase family protein [Escherichia coli P0301867.11]ENC94349.1 amino acid kinase family protein [Escherichia coli P0301867.8]END90331.1 amino acid kinase family protein [Escherichia coli P0301867.13]ENG95782.1 amino acid kinase family protein [Escherichia coli P030186
MSKKIVLALGGNALGDDLAGQMKAVKITSQAIVDLIAQGHEVIVTHGNGPQVGMINQAFEAAAKTEAHSPMLPMSVCVALSQGYIGYDLQNALREELNRPGFPGECFICELRLPDHRFRWKHNKLFLLLPVGYGPAFPAIVDCYTSPPT